jgi:hypothetical protein
MLGGFPLRGKWKPSLSRREADLERAIEEMVGEQIMEFLNQNGLLRRRCIMVIRRLYVFLEYP